MLFIARGDRAKVFGFVEERSTGSGSGRDRAVKDGTFTRSGIGFILSDAPWLARRCPGVAVVTAVGQEDLTFAETFRCRWRFARHELARPSVQ